MLIPNPGQSSPQAFFSLFKKNPFTRAVIRPSDAYVEGSAEEALPALMTSLRNNPGYADHEAVFFQVDVPSQCLFFVFVHSTVRGMAQGGTRMLRYATIDELLFDGLRLSRAMTEKNSMAEIWWGGGKAIICPLQELSSIDKEQRKLIFERYGEFVASLNGVYVAAEDMNTTPEDMLTILSRNRFVTCLPAQVGGSSNPSPWTAKGVFKAMLAAVWQEEGLDSLQGKKVLIQGVGNVGRTLALLAAEAGATVLCSDPNPKAIEALKSALPAAEIVPGDKLFDTPCDIFAPSARGGIIDEAVTEKLQCRYIIGAANNQLIDDTKHSQQLHERNILYLPDFFINRMGIVNCANEQYGYLEDDLIQATEKIYTDVLWLLGTAKQNNQTPYEVAIAQAQMLAAIPHPIWGHRGKRVIQDLVERRFSSKV